MYQCGFCVVPGAAGGSLAAPGGSSPALVWVAARQAILEMQHAVDLHVCRIPAPTLGVPLPPDVVARPAARAARGRSGSNISNFKQTHTLVVSKRKFYLFP